MVVTPSITRAGTAFHSIQNVTNEEVTRMMPLVNMDRDEKNDNDDKTDLPGMKTVVQ